MKAWRKHDSDLAAKLAAAKKRMENARDKTAAMKEIAEI